MHNGVVRVGNPREAEREAQAATSWHHRDARHSGVTTYEQVWERDGISVALVIGDYPAAGWTAPFEIGTYGIGLQRVGAFRRRVDGVEQIVDPNTAFFRRAGDATSVAHFTDRPDKLTVIDLDPDSGTDALAEITEATGPFSVSPAIDLAHQLLLSDLRAPVVDDAQIQARALELLAAGLEQRHSRFSAHSRRTSAAQRRRLVSDVCEELHRSPSITLVELARAVNYSPFHLSRTFREATGLTISAYRVRLRVHDVLNHLDQGVEDLAALAAATGFADHSHMTRTVVAQYGEAPSILRKRLRGLT
jgi:AraC-like DNA-binding protein